MSGKKKTQSTPKSKVKVLYQYLNGTWYAFADVGDDIFFGKVAVPAKAKKGSSGKATRKGGAKKQPPEAT